MSMLDYAYEEDLADLADMAQEYLAERSEDVSAGIELGWFGVGIPEEKGGAGGTREDLAVLIESAGAAHAATPLGFTTGVLGQLLLTTNDDQAARPLADLAVGRLLPLMPASDPRGVRRRLEIDGSGKASGEFLAYGTDNANIVVLPTGTGQQGIVLLDVSTPGIEVARVKAMDVSRPLFVVKLSAVALSEARIELGARALDTMTALCALITALDSAGIARRALTDTLKFAEERHQFGRSLASFQAYKHRVADAYVLLRLTQSAAFRSARANNLRSAYSAAMDGVRNATEICSEAVQLHGAMGFSWETGIHIYLKRARANELFWQDTISTMGAPKVEEN